MSTGLKNRRKNVLEEGLELVERRRALDLDRGNAVDVMLVPIRKRIGARALHRAACSGKDDTVELDAEEPPRRRRLGKHELKRLALDLDLGFDKRALHEVLT